MAEPLALLGERPGSEIGSASQTCSGMRPTAFGMVIMASI